MELNNLNPRNMTDQIVESISQTEYHEENDDLYEEYGNEDVYEEYNFEGDYEQYSLGFEITEKSYRSLFAYF